MCVECFKWRTDLKAQSASPVSDENWPLGPGGGNQGYACFAKSAPGAWSRATEPNSTLERVRAVLSDAFDPELSDSARTPSPSVPPNTTTAFTHYHVC